ncbi:MAG: hypothetical protein GXW85_03520, partial [Clostridia bacterium]|nr:hypothetical protein [Clostridia bacterium]
MEMVLSFLIGFFLNEGRLLYRIFENNLAYIKNKIIIKELGFHYYLFFNMINFAKGYIVISLLAGHSNFRGMLLVCCLMLGYYLGSKPVSPEGNELVIILGAIAAYNWEAIKINLAVLISIIILTKNSKMAYMVMTAGIILLAIKYNLYLGLLAVFLTINYFRYNYALFFPLLNTINKKLDYSVKGVNSLYESFLHTVTKVFTKRFEKSF